MLSFFLKFRRMRIMGFFDYGAIITGIAATSADIILANSSFTAQ